MRIHIYLRGKTLCSIFVAIFFLRKASSVVDLLKKIIKWKRILWTTEISFDFQQIQLMTFDLLENFLPNLFKILQVLMKKVEKLNAKIPFCNRKKSQAKKKLSENCFKFIIFLLSIYFVIIFWWLFQEM